MRLAGRAPLLLLAASLAGLSLPAQAQPDAVDVLFIAGAEPGFAPMVPVVQALKAGIAESGRPANVFIESLDELRFPPSARALSLFEELILTRYARVKFDAIVGYSGGAVTFAVKFRDAHAPGVPVLALGILDQAAPARFAGVAAMYGFIQASTFPPTLRLAARLVPKARKAILIVRTDPTTLPSFNGALGELRRELPGLEIEALVNERWERITASLAAAGENAFTIFLTKDGTLPDGSVISVLDMFRRFSALYPMPYFGTSPSQELIESGLVGGYSIDPALQGRDAASTILAALGNTGKPEPWRVSAAISPTLNYRSLKGFSMPLSAVPPGADIRFAPPPFWIRYETPLKLAGVAAALALLALVAYIVVRWRERRFLRESNERLEREVLERTEELETSNRELEATNDNLEGSLRRIEGMQERLVAETRDAVLGRIALGLAHEINNPLAAIRSSTHSMRKVLERGPSSLPAALVALEGPKLAVFFKLSRLSDRRPEDLEEGDLASRRRAFARRLQALSAGATAELADLAFDADLSGLGDEDLALAAAPENGAVLDALYRARILERGVGVADRAAGRIAQTVEAIRSYARDEAPEGQGSSASVESTVAQALLLFREATRKGVSVALRLDPELPPVAAAASNLVRLWTNLIQNGIQAMGSSGELEIDARRDGGFAVVEILDSGPGLDPSIADKLFVPFVTTKGAAEGMGLGLSICKRIAEGAGGTVSHGLREGRTMFSVRLPLISG